MNVFRSLPSYMMLGLAISSITQGDPLNPKQIPADAKWVVHVDMDAARDTKMWAALDNSLSANADFQSGISKIEQITSATFPRDLHDVTLYGRSADDMAGVVIIHARVNRQQIETLLKMNLAYNSKPYGDYQLLTWHDDDKNKTMFGAFQDDSTMVIGQSEELISKALDVFDDKAEHVKVDSPLAVGAKPQLLAFVAATDLRRWKESGKAQSPIVQQVENAWLSLTESEGKAVVAANIVTKDADTAEQLNQLLNGVKAMVAFSTNSQDADTRAKAREISSLLETLSVKREDKSLIVDWPIAIEKGEQALATLTGKKPVNVSP